MQQDTPGSTFARRQEEHRKQVILAHLLVDDVRRVVICLQVNGLLAEVVCCVGQGTFMISVVDDITIQAASKEFRQEGQQASRR